MSLARCVVLSVSAAVCTACGGRVSAGTAPVPATGTGNVRVYETATGRDVSFAALADAAARADVVFFGEQHDDPETHFAEFALLDAISRRRSGVVVSLEMFERDVQSALDGYLAGRVSETEFLANARPWDRYATDYRSLVVMARANGWPVIAANVPRPIASAVSRKGIAALDTLPAASRAYAARENLCPKDEYYRRFAEQMKDHGGVGPGAAQDTASLRAMTDKFYEAQCVKDETMAESIVQAHARAGKNAIVVHYNGAFHSDGTLGTAARVVRRMPGATHVVITAIPVTDPPTASLAEYRDRADYVVLTKKPPASR